METGESRRSEAGTEQSTEDKVGCLSKTSFAKIVAPRFLCFLGCRRGPLIFPTFRSGI